jgi:hypothetical protein
MGILERGAESAHAGSTAGSIFSVHGMVFSLEIFANPKESGRLLSLIPLLVNL